MQDYTLSISVHGVITEWEGVQAESRKKAVVAFKTFPDFQWIFGSMEADDVARRESCKFGGWVVIQKRYNPYGV